jgi:cardiolipin synthase
LRTGRPRRKPLPADRVLTLPNALTLTRIVCVPVILLLLLAEADLPAAVLFVVAALTDFFDGRLARRVGPTRVGRVLDPLADRLMISGVAIVLALRGILPGWAVAILVLRDLLALLGALVVRGRVRVNRVGKAATAVLMTAVALVVFDLEGMGVILFYVGIALSVVAGAMYAGRHFGLLGIGDTGRGAE